MNALTLNDSVMIKSTMAKDIKISVYLVWSRKPNTKVFEVSLFLFLNSWDLAKN